MKLLIYIYTLCKEKYIKNQMQKYEIMRQYQIDLQRLKQWKKPLYFK